MWDLAKRLLLAQMSQCISIVYFEASMWFHPDQHDCWEVTAQLQNHSNSSLENLLAKRGPKWVNLLEDYSQGQEGQKHRLHFPQQLLG